MRNNVNKIFDTTDPNYDQMRAAKIICQIMFYPQRKNKVNEDKRKLMEGSKHQSIIINNKEVHTYSWNSTGVKKALLVHGFGGSCLDFNEVIRILCKANFHVIGFDAPAHGFSAGLDTDIEEFMQCIRALSASSNSFFDITLAHSFGAAALTHELYKKTLITNKVYLLAANADFMDIVNALLNVMEASKDLVPYILDLVANRFNSRMSADELWFACSTISNIKSINKPNRIQWNIFHGCFDKIINIKQAEEIARVCGEIHQNVLFKTFDCEHTDVLTNAHVLDEIEKQLNF